jgi:hypothetical protein
VCEEGVDRESQHRRVNLEESPVEHVNCEGAR